jgi:hypothetical protein
MGDIQQRIHQRMPMVWHCTNSVVSTLGLDSDNLTSTLPVELGLLTGMVSFKVYNKALVGTSPLAPMH